MRNEHLKMLIISALFAAIIGIAAQIMIKIPPVPFTGQTLALMLTATILGKRYGTISATIYVLMGVIGVPVFSGMLSGLGVIFGPTGGYIIAFIPAAFIIGWLVERLGYSVIGSVTANVIGAMLILFIGTVWLKVFGNLDWAGAFSGGMLPFIIPDILKAVVSAVIGIMLYKRLTSARLLPSQVRV